MLKAFKLALICYIEWMIETDRLILRPWIPDDQKDQYDAFRLWSDVRVMEKLGGALDLDGVIQRLSMEQEFWHTRGVQYWRVAQKQSHDFVGCAGLRPASSREPGAYEVGFHILPNKWGNGFATEAARAAIRYGFDRLDLNCIFAGHHPENAASCAVLLKLGFKKIGTCFYPPTGLDHPWYEHHRGV